jgi:hypothetical protein
MNTTTKELNTIAIESAEAALDAVQTQEAIDELNACELALVGGGSGSAILY